MNKIRKKIAGVLAFFLMFSSVITEGQVPGVAMGNEGHYTVTLPSGEVIKEDATWEEVYPTGVFAFKDFNILFDENNGEGILKIYRLGGTKGSAVAKVVIVPVVNEESTAYGLSKEDYVIVSPDISEEEEGLFGAISLDVVFEEGEMEKDIIFQGRDDDEHEITEFATVTIIEAVGAELVEAANRATIGVLDDEAYIQSEVGFSISSIVADRAKGNAEITVERTTGSAYVCSVDFEAKSGTAVEGIDFVTEQRTLYFDAGVESAVIEIPLINDFIKTEASDKFFTVELSNVKGGTLIAGQTCADVYLTNSYEFKEGDELNLPTILYTTEAEDLSSRVVALEEAVVANENKEITPEYVETPQSTFEEEELGIPFKISTFADVQSQGVVQSGARPTQGDIKGMNETETFAPGKAGDWNARSSEGKIGVSVTNNTVHVWDDEYNDPQGSVVYKGNSTILQDLWEKYKTASITGRIKSSNGDSRYALGFTTDNQNKHNPTSIYFFDIKKETGEKTFSNLGLNTTMNLGDAIKNNSNVCNMTNPILYLGDHNWKNNTDFKMWLDSLTFTRATVPEDKITYVIASNDISKIDSYTEQVDFQKKLDVDVSTVRGGVTKNGGYIIDSEFSVGSREPAYKITNIELYNTATKEKITSSMTNKFVFKSTASTPVERAKQLSSYTAQRGDGYEVRITLEREQAIKIGFDLGDESNKDEIINQVQTSVRVNNQPLKTNLEQDTLKVQGVKEIYTINFNQPNLLILYNQKVYKGNETITIPVDQYTVGELNFQVYTQKTAVEKQTVEITGISRIELYQARNEEGKPSEGDRRIAVLNGETYNQELLAPSIVGDSIYPKYLKVAYTLTPRILMPPTGYEEEYCEVVLAFQTASTNKVYLETIDPLMKRPRDIKVEKIPVIGEASSVAEIIIPLGGNIGTEKFNNGCYEIDQRWKGRLTEKYRREVEMPAEIKADHDLLGENAVVASGENQVNNYLGSFQDNDTFMLKVYDVYEDNQLESAFKGSFRSIKTFMPGNITMDMDKSEAKVESNETAKQMPEVASVEPKMTLPNLNVSADIGPASVFMDEDIIGFTIGVPIVEGSTTRSLDKNVKKNESELVPGAKQAIDSLAEALGKKDKNNKTNNIFEQLKNAGKGQDKDGNFLPKQDISASFNIAVSATATWKYSPEEEKWHFYQGMFFLNIGGNVRASAKLPPPVSFIYVYVVVGGELTLGTGIEYVEAGRDSNGVVQRKVAFAGIEISPQLFLEVGGGVGVPMLGVEIFLKANIGLTMVANNDFYVKDFEVGAGLGFRVNLLIFSYEMDVVYCEVNYEDSNGEAAGGGEWTFKWGAFDGLLGGDVPISRSFFLEDTSDLLGNALVLDGNLSSRQHILSESKTLNHVSETVFGVMPFTFDEGDGDDFSLSKYSEGSDGFKIGEAFAADTSYKLITANGKDYIFYIVHEIGRSDVDKQALVFSELSYDATQDKGFVLKNPINPDAGVKYAIINKDHTGDLEFDVTYNASTESLQVAWSSFKEQSEYVESLDAVASKVCIKKATISTTSSQLTISTPIEVPSATEGNYKYIPRVVANGNHTITAYIETIPMSEEGIQSRSESRESTINENGPTAKMERELGVYMDVLFGRTSLINIQLNEEEIVSIPLPGSSNKSPRLIDFAMYEEDDQLFLAFITEESTTKEKIKRLYFIVGSFEGEVLMIDGTPKLFKTFVDHLEDNTKDGEYIGTELSENIIDPSLLAIEFMKAKISPTGDVEKVFTFKMNNRQYIIDSENLDALKQGGIVKYKPFFEMDLLNSDPNVQSDGDSINDFNLCVNSQGEIVAVYTLPVAYTANNALYISQYDSSTETWGEGKLLAMRKLDNYYDLVEGKKTVEEAKAVYDADLTRFILRNPQMLMKETSGGNDNIVMVVEGIKTELEEVTEDVQLIDEKGTNSTKTVTQIIPKREQVTTIGGATQYRMVPSQKSYYALVYAQGEKAIGEANLQCDSIIFTPGAQIRPQISFRNTGDLALQATESEPIEIQLMLGDLEGNSSVSLGKWEIRKDIPSGRKIFTEELSDAPIITLPSNINALEDDNQYLYFTVSETYGEAKKFSANSLVYENGRKILRDCAELGFDKIEYKIGGQIITKGTQRFVPIDLDVEIANSGTKVAQNVQLKVAYVKEENGNEIVNPLLQLGKDGLCDIGELGANETYSLLTHNSDQDDTNDLLVPVQCFTEQGLQLKLTITGVDELGSEIDEYDMSNNTATVTVAPKSFIQAPEVIKMSMGQSQEVSVRIATTFNQDIQDIIIEEIPSVGQDSILKDIKLESTSEQGVKQLTLYSVTPGTSMVRVSVPSTNTFKDIVVDVGGGETHFTKDVEGMTYVPTSGFEEVEDENRKVLNASMDQATILFKEKTNKLELYFKGEVIVESKNIVGSREQQLIESTDYQSPVTVLFDNPDEAFIEIKLILSEGTKLEKYIAYLNPVLNEEDLENPTILLGALPTEKRIQPYALNYTLADNQKLAQVRLLLEDTELVKKDITGSLYVDSYGLTQNGKYTLEVIDWKGNKVVEQFEIQNIFPSDGKYKQHTISLQLLHKDEVIKVGEIVNSDLTLVYEVSGGEEITSVEVNDEVINEINKDNYRGLFTVKENGTYTIKVMDIFGQSIKKDISVNQIDKVAPVIFVGLDKLAEGDKKAYRANQIIGIYEENLEKIVVTKDDEQPITYTNKEFATNGVGSYLIEAVDAAGNKCKGIVEIQEELHEIVISTDPSEGGSVEGGGIYENNQTITVKAMEKENYRFIGWMENEQIISTDLAYTFIVGGPRRLVAMFKKEYKVDVVADKDEAGYVKGVGIYLEGEKVTVEAVPNIGYEFIGWTEEGVVVSDERIYTFPVQKVHKLIANFKAIYEINVSVNNEQMGKVLGGGNYLEGDQVVLTAVEALAHNFVNWTEDGKEVSKDRTYSFIADQSRQVVANFRPIYSMEVTSNISGVGSIVTEGTGEEGTVFTAIASAYPGYQFINWTEAGEEVCKDSKYTFTVEGPRCIVANFKALHEVKLSAQNEERGIVVGEGIYLEGEVVTVKAISYFGYYFGGWMEDNKIISGEQEYSFVLKEPRNLMAIFTKESTNTSSVSANKYKLKVEATKGGTVVGQGEYKQGTQVTAKALCDQGYRFLYWTENGETVSREATYTFILKKDVDLKAHFEMKEVYPEIIFKDVPASHWGAKSITLLTQKGIVKGYTDGTFKPSKVLTKKENLIFLNRMYTYVIGHTSIFLDKQLNALNKEQSAQPMSREYLAQILYEMTEGKLETSIVGSEFKDVEDSPYKEAIVYCIKTGLLKGTSSSTMSPKKAVTRAEMMIVLENLETCMSK